FLCENTGGF
nr:immunoglobulin heavy chain junction region [Mus musculus]